uniref:Globin family profile domain-containing protein n=1 Tax=Setaria digitata TaxID=48799 RepID=A0A915PLU8_9BILA
MSCSETKDVTSSVEKWYDFDDAETRLLRRSWKTMQTEKQTIACNIYRMIFDQCPEARQLFSFMHSDLNSCKKKSNEFIFQALRFIQVLESGVNSLDDLEAFDPILDNLGRRHGKLESSIGFRRYYWSVFLECSIYHIRLALLNSKVDRWNTTDVDNVIILWRYLISGICERIKRGYLADIANRSMLTARTSPKMKLLSVLPPIPKAAGSSVNVARIPLYYQFTRWLFSRGHRDE